MEGILEKDSKYDEYCVEMIDMIMTKLTEEGIDDFFEYDDEFYDDDDDYDYDEEEY